MDYKQKQSGSFSRINWIDWSKSICIFLVILGHTHINESQSYIIQYIYTFHIPLFFVLSGLLCKRNLLYKQVVEKDFKYLIIPYCTYGIIIIIFHSLTSHSVNLYYYINNLQILLLGEDNKIGPIWFLLALFFTKQMYYLIEILSRRNHFLFLLSTLISLVPFYMLSCYKLNIPFFIDSALCGLPFLLFGTYLNTYMKCLTKINKKLLIVYFVFSIAISMTFFHFNGMPDLSSCCYGSNIIFFYVCAISGCLTIITLSVYLNKYVFRYVTVTSYGTIVIVGLSGFFLSVLNYYVPHFFGFHLITYNIFIALAFSFITMIICYYFIILLDKKYYYLFGLKGNSMKKLF